jgi:hypothetical protein
VSYLLKREIFCDRCGEAGPCFSKIGVVPSAVALRAYAAREGWRRTPGGLGGPAQDYCPECVRKAREATSERRTR